MSASIEAGDTIIATWTTPRGLVKKVRGEVIAVRKGTVRFKWQRTTVRGSSIDMAIVESTRPLENCRKVERKPGEVPVGSTLTALVHALAGQPISDDEAKAIVNDVEDARAR